MSSSIDSWLKSSNKEDKWIRKNMHAMHHRRSYCDLGKWQFFWCIFSVVFVKGELTLMFIHHLSKSFIDHLVLVHWTLNTFDGRHTDIDNFKVTLARSLYETEKKKKKILFIIWSSIFIFIFWWETEWKRLLLMTFVCTCQLHLQKSDDF